MIEIGLQAEAVGGDHHGVRGTIIGYGREDDEHGEPVRALIRYIDGRKWKLVSVNVRDLKIERKVA